MCGNCEDSVKLVMAKDIPFVKRGAAKHPSFFEENLLYLCKKEGFIFNGWILPWKGNHTKFNFICPKGHSHFMSYFKFFNYGQRCKKCVANRRHTEKQAVDNIKKVAPDYTNIKFDDGYNGIESKFSFTCPKGHNNSMSYNNFVNSGTRCCDCCVYGYRPNKPGNFYVQKLFKNSALYAIKFGITNNTVEFRMKRQINKSRFTHELFEEFHFEDGNIPLEIEKEIKKQLSGKTGYVSKTQMKDGYTETVAPEHLSTIMFITKTFKK
ncbi:endonuclease [Klebsiella phage iPHaGe-KPN-11i]|nr:endonuclease [Klebsiella phage iPHaGe-KPN-12i]WOL25500.1 endonuclease [Klebsiella phage iPHaGe-KPN-11i]